MLSKRRNLTHEGQKVSQYYCVNHRTVGLCQKENILQWYTNQACNTVPHACALLVFLENTEAQQIRSRNPSA